MESKKVFPISNSTMNAYPYQDNGLLFVWKYGFILVDAQNGTFINHEFFSFVAY